MPVLTSTPPNFPFRTFAVLLTCKPMPLPVCTERNLGDMGPSSITSCTPPTLATKSLSLTSLSHLLRFRSLFSTTFKRWKNGPRQPLSLHHLFTQLAGLTIPPSVSGSPMSILTFLLNTVSQCCGRAGERARSHGPTLGYRDVHQESVDGQGAVWNSYLSHVPQYESLASAFCSTMDHWVGYTADAIPRSTIDPILATYKVLCSKYQAGAARLAFTSPHTCLQPIYSCFLHVRS